jgi:hypothetical protein
MKGKVLNGEGNQVETITAVLMRFPSPLTFVLMGVKRSRSKDGIKLLLSSAFHAVWVPGTVPNPLILLEKSLVKVGVCEASLSCGSLN